MANPYILQGIMPSESMGIPDAPQIMRRQQLAENLLKQSQEAPQSEMVSGRYVAPSWTQYLAQAVRGVQAQGQLSDIDKQLKQYNEQKRQAIANVLLDQQPKQVTETKQEQYLPAYEPSQMDRFGSPMQPREMQTRDVTMQRMESPEEAQNRQRANLYQAISTYGNEPALQLALNDLNYGRQRADTRTDLTEGRTYQEGRDALKRQQALEDIGNQQEFQRIMMKEQQGFQLNNQERQFAQQYKMLGAQQEFQSQQNKANHEFQAGQNQLARQNAVDVAQAKLQLPQNQKVKDAQDVIGILQQAAPLINKSTGSGIGSLADAAQGFFGGTNEGAIASSQLKALEGLLISKMPKMSGPQSDKDVLLYKQMAGQIGDPSIPAAQKRAAMQTINEINSRYLGMQPPKLNFDGKQSLPRLNTIDDAITQELKNRGLL